MQRFEVIVIGSGQGGNPFAIESAGRGRKTALFEHGPVGGTCINTGCTPTKTMIASGKVAYLAGRGAEYGVETGPIVIDMVTIRKRKRDIVKEFSGISEEHDLGTKNLTLIRETASFIGPKTLKAGDTEYEADIIVIDTGSLPVIPNLPGLRDTPFYDNASLMELDIVPEHLLILGGGYIGLEFGQLFTRLGSRVTIIERSTRFLSREDQDMADEISKILREDGLEVLLKTEINLARKRDKTIILEGVGEGKQVTLEGSHLLVALGRKPNTGNLNLGRAGIETTEKGWIQVNDRLETSVPGVYAIGDVNGGPQFTHISYDDFRILRANLFEDRKRTTKDRPVPYVVFIDPQFGRVGLTEEMAKQDGFDYRAYKMPMNDVARALETAESRGVIKALVDTKTEKILGVAVLGLEGGEILNMLQIAMMGGMSYKLLRDGIFSHPTLGECLNNLFQD